MDLMDFIMIAIDTVLCALILILYTSQWQQRFVRDIKKRY
jgi:hypothetical protein